MSRYTQARTLGFDATEYVTSRDVAEAFGVCLDTVRRWTRAGKLQAVKVGRSKYYKADEVQAAFEAGELGSKPGSTLVNRQ
jgi:excisionase family DNA binding protein